MTEMTVVFNETFEKQYLQLVMILEEMLNKLTFINNGKEMWFSFSIVSFFRHGEWHKVVTEWLAFFVLFFSAQSERFIEILFRCGTITEHRKTCS